jgi:hypothetical protein
MEISDVTLGESARRWCQRLGVPESDLKSARAGSVTTYEGTQYLIVTGELPDGRAIRMQCRHDRSNHIVSFRPVS